MGEGYSEPHQLTDNYAEEWLSEEEYLSRKIIGLTSINGPKIGQMWFKIYTNEKDSSLIIIFQQQPAFQNFL